MMQEFPTINFKNHTAKYIELTIYNKL